MMAIPLLRKRSFCLLPTVFMTSLSCFALPPSTPAPLPPEVPELIIGPPPIVESMPMATDRLPLTNPKTTLVSHNDPIAIDAKLTLAAVVASTLEKMPDTQWLAALEDEAVTLRGRGDSWAAGASQAGLRFQEATSGTMHYIDATVQVPLWNLGQRDAEQRVVKFAEQNILAQTDALKLRVAGLVRNALWGIALADLNYEQTRIEANTLQKLLETVEQRVALGDLPRADVLLAKTELLQKQSVLVQAEAELMHARKRYLNITQGAKLPGSYHETLANLDAIQQSHPTLAALTSQIERKQAEINAATKVGSGQTQLAVGINSDRGNNDPRSNQTESFNIGVTVPFGGEANTLNPHLAGLRVELNKLFADRQQLLRDLELAHHEAEHNLQVNQMELQIADELQHAAKQHLQMMELSFSVGEINLIDLLKIQTRSQQAILNAKQRAVILQRDNALYNQAVGILP